MLAFLALAGASQAQGQANALVPALEPLRFLVGRWEGGGAVSDPGGRAHGVSLISVEADGRALLRSDRNQVFDKAGNPTGSFGQLMTIYPDADGVRADYVDGEGHVIHYGPAKIVPGASAEFTSIAPPGAPVFRLRYDARGPDGLKVAFMIEPPGQTDFQPIAVGEVHRTPPTPTVDSVPTRTPLASLRLPKPKTVDYVEATRVDFAPGQAMPPHHHSAPVVCIVAEGSFAVKIGGRPEMAVPTAGVTLEAPGERVDYFRNLSSDRGAVLMCTVLAADGDAPINVTERP